MLLTSCKKCHKKITNNNITRHYLSCKGIVIKKIRGIDFDPNIGYKLGTRTIWNKGLTAKTDRRVRKYTESIIKARKLIPYITSLETKIKISIACKKAGCGGYIANAGRSKKYHVADSFGKIVCLQSSYEYKLSILLNQYNIKWIRPKALRYIDLNNISRLYYPDFYLPLYNIYLDPKNDYLIKIDSNKIKLVSKQNKINIYILNKNELNKESINKILLDQSLLKIWDCRQVGKASDL